jgi:phosphoribosylformylglycinamidine synthase
VSVPAGKEKEFKAVLGDHPYEFVGRVTSGSINVDGESWGEIPAWKETYNTAIEKFLGGANN